MSNYQDVPKQLLLDNEFYNNLENIFKEFPPQILNIDYHQMQNDKFVFSEEVPNGLLKGHYTITAHKLANNKYSVNYRKESNNNVITIHINPHQVLFDTNISHYSQKFYKNIVDKKLYQITKEGFKKKKNKTKTTIPIFWVENIIYPFKYPNTKVTSFTNEESFYVQTPVMIKQISNNITEQVIKTEDHITICLKRLDVLVTRMDRQSILVNVVRNGCNKQGKWVEKEPRQFVLASSSIYLPGAKNILEIIDEEELSSSKELKKDFKKQ